MPASSSARRDPPLRRAAAGPWAGATPSPRLSSNAATRAASRPDRTGRPAPALYAFLMSSRQPPHRGFMARRIASGSSGTTPRSPGALMLDLLLLLSGFGAFLLAAGYAV